MPRAACHYRRLEFAQLPVRQRAAAAKLAVRRHEPAPGALQHVAWTGATAHAWIWPQPDPVMAEGEPGWIPESLLRAPPAGDGPRLLQAIEGVEGQVWRDGQLQASQWWPAVPDADAWRRFLRACGIGPDAAGAVPAPETLPWETTPWGDAPRGLPGSPAALERLAWVAGLGLVALCLGWQLAAQATWGIAQWRLEGRRGPRGAGGWGGGRGGGGGGARPPRRCWKRASAPTPRWSGCSPSAPCARAPTTTCSWPTSSRRCRPMRAWCSGAARASACRPA
ncbi:hypothetical protein [Arenimonas sp.]|uniref:hypothetical protein n=1 Tax=Arenimonas sp. TaxID=1872635 RepID=UPI0035AFE7E1